MGIDIFTKYIGKFIFFVLLQIVVLNNIEVSGLGITPFLYLIFILLLPFETPKWLLIVFGFFLGLFIDISTDTGGSHAAATVFIAFIRPTVLQLISPRNGYEHGTNPRIFHFGIAWFLKYALIFVIAHHFIYFFVETFSFDHFFTTIAKIFLTTIFTTILIILSQFLIFRK